MRPYTAPGKLSVKRSLSAFSLAALVTIGACAPAMVTTPGPVDPIRAGREPNVRVGIAVDTTSVQISATTPLELVDASTNRTISTVPVGTAVSVSAEGSQRIRARVGNADVWTSGALLVARPQRDGTLTIAGRAYRGTGLVRISGPGRVTAINQVDMEAYLLGVVPREIGRVGEELLEAAKAQAVAARTYAVRYMGRRESLGFDVFATVQDQVYGGLQDEHDPVSRAVRETAGEVMLHNGQPIEAFYHSTCAGQTAAIEEVWNEAPRPYLRSVVDRDPVTGEAYDRASNRFTWTQRWTAQEITDILNRTLADSLPAGVRTIGEIQEMRVLERTPSDRVRRMRIATTNGTFHVGGDRIRWILPTQTGAILNSSKFDVQLVRDGAGRLQEVVANGGGWGHGIGMCQVGAMGRARAGQNYRTILTTYYTGVEIRQLY
jgi:stage II sporulation protein D